MKDSLCKTTSAGAVILAAGQGERFGEKKQFKLFKNSSLLTYVITTFYKSKFISEIVVVVPKEFVGKIDAELKQRFFEKPIKVISGGKKRQESTLLGINSLSEKNKLVCIHDVARPFITYGMIEKTISACKDSDGAIIAIPARDTLKKVKNGKIVCTVRRNEIWQSQTPQTYKRKMLKEALLFAEKEELIASDEAFLFEKLGHNVTVIEGSVENFKITTPEDWHMAELIWRERYG